MLRATYTLAQDPAYLWISVLCLGRIHAFLYLYFELILEPQPVLSLRVIFGNKKSLLHIHTRKEGPVPALGIQILLATRAAAMVRGMDGRDYRLGILRVQVRTPVVRSRGIRPNSVHTG
jgi:hypothetical protein